MDGFLETRWETSSRSMFVESFNISGVDGSDATIFHDLFLERILWSLHGTWDINRNMNAI